MKNKPIILLIAGEGGHLEQARRFNQMHKDMSDAKFIIITDEKNETIKLDCEVVRMKNISAITKKRSIVNVFLFSIILFFESIKVLHLLLKIKPKGLIAFGPLMCFPFIIIAKLLRIKCVFIETWSKFFEPTLTVKYCKFLVDRVYFQNKTLNKKLPKAIYGGKL